MLTENFYVLKANTCSQSYIQGFSKFKMLAKANAKKKDLLSTHKLDTACQGAFSLGCAEDLRRGF